MQSLRVTRPHPWLVTRQSCIHVSCQQKAKGPLITILSLTRLFMALDSRNVHEWLRLGRHFSVRLFLDVTTTRPLVLKNATW